MSRDRARAPRRLVLVDWNATAAAPGIEALRRAGHRVQLLVPTPGSSDLRALLDAPPDAILIDLDRRPGTGRDIAIWLRQRVATRQVPIVFVGGAAEKVAAMRVLLPDASFAVWPRIGAALRQAWRAPVQKPVVRTTMSPYSGTPLAKKLGIRAAARVALLGAPPAFETLLAPLPENVRLQRQLVGAPERILLFARSQADLRRRFPAAARRLADAGSIWLLWRKRASGAVSDLGEKEVRAFGLERGFVDYKIAAIDATWSGLRFARRRVRTAAAGRRRGSRAR